VLVLVGLLLLHAAVNTSAQNMTPRNLFLALIFHRRFFSLSFGHRLAGHTIFTFDPPAEIDKLASL
jgi:hypothetical protein